MPRDINGAGQGLRTVLSSVAEAVDLDPPGRPGAGTGRVGGHADPDGVPVTTRSPGSRVMVRLMKLTSSATPNTISPCSSLAQLVVDQAADAEGLRVGHLVGRDQVRAEGQEGVDRLAQQPLGGAELERPREEPAQA